jgi:hypothetical protein
MRGLGATDNEPGREMDALGEVSAERAFDIQDSQAEAPLSFRLGLRMVDLEANMRAGNTAQTRSLLTELIEMAEGLENPTEALVAANELLAQVTL